MTANGRLDRGGDESAAARACENVEMKWSRAKEARVRGIGR